MVTNKIKNTQMTGPNTDPMITNHEAGVEAAIDSLDAPHHVIAAGGIVRAAEAVSDTPVISNEAELVSDVDPFSAFGSLGSKSPVERQAPRATEPLAVDEESANESAVARPGFSDEDQEIFNDYVRKSDERREAKRELERAELSVTIDREAIRNILQDHPEIFPVGNMETLWAGEAESIEARRAELQRTLDTIANLPEHLDFDPGITIIIGDNGSGKSTLARALQLRIKAEERYREGLGLGASHDEFIDKELDPAGYERTNGGESIPSSMAMLVARHIKVDTLESFGTNLYFDATVASGQRQGGVLTGQQRIEMSMLRGGSHGQISRGALDFLKDIKASHEEDIEKGRKPNTGPAVVFLDEVENGLSPRNHRKLQQSIEDATIEGSIVIFPTNSMVMYESDNPRIDLDHPELGIITPSEHPELYE